MREALQKKLQQDGVDHSTDMTSDGQMVVSIISPLMKRAHSLREAGEMVFLDASGGMDGHQARLFLLLTHCPGAFLTTSESEEAVTMGLAQLKQLAGETGFNCRGIKGPMVFMVDDARAEHAAIMSTYPDATILLCSFHVQQAFETVISNRLLDIAHGGQELKIRRKEPTGMKAIVTHKHGEQYEVGIGKTKRLVQADLGLCSCFYGRCGNLCKHIWAVMDSKDFGSGVHHYKPRTEQREQLFWLATGQKANKGWLEPLHPCIDNEIIHAAIVGEEMVENESDTGATREMCFSDLEVIPKITPPERERWQAAIDAFHKEKSEKLQTSYEAAMYGPAFETFFEGGRPELPVRK
ncbi:uncharacterized protein [Watersipora subatra]|uniref:uncharacterized protein n=1 Tax=Watersipora subatra TaxID=2589382 RepID=UPI00355B5939